MIDTEVHKTHQKLMGDKLNVFRKHQKQKSLKKLV